MTQPKILTFRKGQFFFLEKGKPPATLDLGAAVRLQKFADESAQRVVDRILVKQYSLPSAPLPAFLDAPHQVDGVRWILSRSRSYLAHAPGAGKTVQAIVAALLAEGTGQVVVVVPPGLTVNWEREIWTFTEWAGQWPTISVVPDSPHQENIYWGADFLIVPDSMLAKPWVLAALHARPPFKLLAVDEASRFKEATSQRTIALFGGKLKCGGTSSGLQTRARRAVLLDGSPMPNRAMELWAPTYAMAPQAINFMSQQDFGFRYCGATINDYGRWEFKHSANEAELRLALQKDFMHVVTEEQLNHPERKRSMLFMNEDVRSPEHKTWEKTHLSSRDFNEEMCQGDMAAFRRELGVKKIPYIAEYVAERLTRKGESILLFVWHREVATELAKRLDKFGPGLVIGGTPNEEREEAFEDFQRGACPIIIGNILAMGRGHNLQRADRVIFGEFSWTDEVNKQAEKRTSRRGNDKAFVRCEYIVCPSSMDEVVLKSVFRKAQAVRKVIG